MPNSEQDNTSSVEFESLEKCFYAKRVLPDATHLFDRKIPLLREIIDECIIVLDTNVLLLPYAGRKMSTQEVIDVYKKIKDANRLFIPAQVAREFNKNRPLKIGEMHKAILDKLSKINVSVDISYSALEGLEDYEKLKKSINDIAKKKTELDNVKNRLVRNIQKWVWNDPVSIEYGEIFTAECIVEPEIDEQEEYKTCKDRYALKIPPGYKDSAKPDGGIGDYLIWKTILKIGDQYKKPLIFVTGDEKTDWQHRAGDHVLMPRYELFDEYWRASEGRPFYICSLSDFLEHQNASKKLVDEVRSEEASIVTEKDISTKNTDDGLSTAKQIFHFITSRGGKDKDDDGDINFISFTPRLFEENDERPVQSSKRDEMVSCPICEEKNTISLGIKYMSTQWCICGNCGTKFATHRQKNGSFKVSRASIS